jgi:zinc/manganese transport system substrate-binding protein
MIMRTTLILKTTIVLLATLAVSACTAAAEERQSIEVVVTTSILGDIAANVVGDDALLEVIMSPGADPHEFEPSARQVASMLSANLIVANGLGLEESLEDVLDSAVEDGVAVIEIGSEVEPVRLTNSNGFDPHVWLDPVRMAGAVDSIVEALVELDASVDWAAQAAPYRQELLEVDTWIDQQLEFIPPDTRVLLTGHQNLGYFADRYGFEVVATILPGATTMIEPSASGFADVIDVLEASRARAILTDFGESQALAEQLTEQMDRDVAVVPLHVGALGSEGSGAETYLDLMRWNVEAIRAVFEQ